MAEPKWTPGPWRVVGGNEVAAQDGGVAEIVTWYRDHDEIVANAHLIAAAPYLYEACSKVIEELVNIDCDCAPESGYECFRCWALEKLEAALRKARGEADA